MDIPTIEPTNTNSLAGDATPAVTPTQVSQNSDTTPTAPMQAPAVTPAANVGDNTPAAANAQQGAPEAQDEPLPPSLMQAPGEEPPVQDVVPEQYAAFNIPEGYDLDPTAIQNCGDQFREMGLSQAKAQKMVDLHYRMIQQQEALYQKQINDSARQWYNEIHSRPDFANEQSLVNKGIAAVVKTQQQRELFKNPTFAYSPLIWDMFREVGKIVAEDSIVSTHTQSAPPVDDNPYHINL